ncbi:MAG TPA: LLM class flavin-dependent oxidoreductase [Novosphingobium sp.]|nr:LLM class flavin-dependent oxidoreductase [Novosphingobium sp.]
MSVRIGMSPGIGTTLSPAEYWQWVELCEDSGIDSIWHSDQLLGATLEPLTMLAALAARTTRLRFGTNALVLPFREPLVVAKQLATIDHLSGGRAFPVFGVGRDSDPYWAATDRSAGDRGSRTNEALALIGRLLSQDTVDFAGAHLRYRGPGVRPQPARPMPLWIGGHSAAAIRRTAELGDGWLGGLLTPRNAGETKARIEAELVRTGRRIETDHFGVSLPLFIGAPGSPGVIAAKEQFEARLPAPDRAGLSQAVAVGWADHVVSILREYVTAGMSKFVAVPIVRDAAELMDQTRLLAREVVPRIERGAAAQPTA